MKLIFHKAFAEKKCVNPIWHIFMFLELLALKSPLQNREKIFPSPSSLSKRRPLCSIKNESFSKTSNFFNILENILTPFLCHFLPLKIRGSNFVVVKWYRVMHKNWPPEFFTISIHFWAILRQNWARFCAYLVLKNELFIPIFDYFYLC